jgi:UDP-N-acetyl-D-galactosamine dehydrogenase
LKAGNDRTHELTKAQLQAVTIEYSADPTIIAGADIVIVAVPTPIDDQNKPDLTMLESATATVGRHVKKGAIVVFESTVWPGTTEEICGPILERESGLKCGTDFTLGYSPERINPGDKEHTVDRIMKVVAGQDDRTTETLCDLYGSVVQAGVHRSPSIKVAEMAKAIENAQRDLNIAFVNEVAMLSHRLGIATNDVLAAAGTKWNFLPFKPGLVGGHCIGVDPYYLVEKARQLGMETHVITAGRSVNDGMAAHVAEQIVSALPVPKGARVLILGLTFKENVPDTRNSKVKDVAKALAAAGCTVVAHDPFYNPEETKAMGYTPGSLADGEYDAVALLVPHKEYVVLKPPEFEAALKSGGVLYDLKSCLAGGTREKLTCKVLSL